METTRREFLRMFGLGGVAMAGGTVFPGYVMAAKKPKGFVVFTADDASLASLDIAQALYGLPVTGFAITGRVGTPGYLTLEQMKTLQKKYKWEWQNHTDSHRYFSGLSDQEIFDDIRVATQKLRAWGFRNVVALAPPGGDFGEGEGNIEGHRLDSIMEQEGSIAICREAYPQDLSDLSTMVNYRGAFNPMRIKAFSIKKSNVGTDPANIPELFYDLIYAAREEGAMVVFVLHGVNDDPNDDYSVSPAVLASMVDYIKRQLKRQLQVTTLTKAVAAMD